MAGRAGRPQFDDEGVCVIMTRNEMRGRYESLLSGTETVESHMHEHQLTQHLNAEIASAGTPPSERPPPAIPPRPMSPDHASALP